MYGNDEAKVIKIRLGTMNLVYNVRTCMYVLEMIFLGKLKRLKVCTSSENWVSLFSEKD